MTLGTSASVLCIPTHLLVHCAVSFCVEYAAAEVGASILAGMTHCVIEISQG